MAWATLCFPSKAYLSRSPLHILPFTLGIPVFDQIPLLGIPITDTQSRLSHLHQDQPSQAVSSSPMDQCSSFPTALSLHLPCATAHLSSDPSETQPALGDRWEKDNDLTKPTRFCSLMPPIRWSPTPSPLPACRPHCASSASSTCQTPSCTNQKESCMEDTSLLCEFLCIHQTSRTRVCSSEAFSAIRLFKPCVSFLLALYAAVSHLFM